MNKFTQSTFIALSLLVSFALVPKAYAEDASAQTAAVTGNGAESNNSVSTSQSNTTNVQQNNDATVHNTIKSDSNTGGNSASSNTGGDTKIVTGDAAAKTAVQNTANTSVVDASGCNNCQNSGSTAVVSGNGTGSQNSVSSSNSNQTNVSVSNNATVTNNIKIKANTGNNSADYNTGGNTVIKTGDIRVATIVDNGPINTAKVKVQGNGNTTLSSYLKIAGNGAFSENNIYSKNKSYTNIAVENNADILNNIKTILNTGNNSADYNTGGDVVIVTGDIDVATLINNVANFSLVEIVCGCEKKHHPEKPLTPNEEIPGQPSAPAPPTTTVGGPGGPGGPSSPEAPGSSPSTTTTTLPVTGNNLLFFLLLANVMMFLLGTYLRLRSGRSPGIARA